MPSLIFKSGFWLIFLVSMGAFMPRVFSQSLAVDSVVGNRRFETDEPSTTNMGRTFSHSLLLGRGGSTTDAMFDGNKPAGIATEGYEHRPLPGAISLTYRTKVSDKVEVGAAFVCENDGGRLYFISWNGSRNSYSTWVGRYKRMVYTIAPEFTYVYKRHRFTATYSSLALGVSYQNDVHIFDEGYFYSHYANGHNWLGNEIQQEHNRFHTNFQLTVIGWRYSKRIGCFAELGMGYKGVLCLGASYNFGTEKRGD